MNKTVSIKIMRDWHPDRTLYMQTTSNYLSVASETGIEAQFSALTLRDLEEWLTSPASISCLLIEEHFTENKNGLPSILILCRFANSSFLGIQGPAKNHPSWHHFASYILSKESVAEISEFIKSQHLSYCKSGQIERKSMSAIAGGTRKVNKWTTFEVGDGNVEFNLFATTQFWSLEAAFNENDARFGWETYAQLRNWISNTSATGIHLFVDTTKPNYEEENLVSNELLIAKTTLGYLLGYSGTWGPWFGVVSRDTLETMLQIIHPVFASVEINHDPI